MPAKQLRCAASVIPYGDATGENAIECGAVALTCADCGYSAGSEEHAVFCPKCGKPVCDYCAGEHACVVEAGETSKAALWLSELARGAIMATEKISQEPQTTTKSKCAHPACSCAPEEGSSIVAHTAKVPETRLSFPATVGTPIAR